MMFVYDVTMTMPNGDQVTERVRAEDEGLRRAPGRREVGLQDLAVRGTASRRSGK